MARKIHSVLAITLLFASVNGLFAQDKMAKTATSDAPKYSLFAPNNQAEFGISVGYSTLIGDFVGQPGVGLGLSIRKALDYTFSIRGELGYQMVNSEAPTNGAFPYLGDVTKNIRVYCSRTRFPTAVVQ